MGIILEELIKDIAYRLLDETVWLNQQQIAVLFGTQRQAITKHLKNIFESGELERQATCSILELVQKEGNRMVRRNVEIYNLDVIISIGYRVNTKRGIQFRQWANKIIKDYMLKGMRSKNTIEYLGMWELLNNPLLKGSNSPPFCKKRVVTHSR